MDLSYIPWFAWIVILAILVGGVIAVVESFAGRNKDATRALQENSEINAKLLARLDGIDARLLAVENTLNDIPG